MTAARLALLAVLATGQIVLGATAVARAVTFDHAPAAFHVTGAAAGCLCLATAIALLWLGGHLERRDRA